MSTGIYVIATGRESGKSVVTLGLVELLSSRSDRVGFFKPVTDTDDPESDPMVALVRDRYGLDAASAVGGVSLVQARDLLASGRANEISERCLEVYSAIAARSDVVVVEGTNSSSLDPGFEFDINVSLAKDLGALVFAVLNGADRTPEQSVLDVDTVRGGLLAAGSQIMAILVNRVDPADVERLQGSVHLGSGGRRVYVIPETPELSWPTVTDIASHIDAEQIAGAADLDRDVRSVKVAAMNAGHLLDVLEAGSFVVSPSDRVDVMMATLASSLSPEFPVPSGLLLTGGFAVTPRMQRLLSSAPFPVLTVDTDTYVATRSISRVRSEISSNNTRKLAAAIGLWEAHVDPADILERVELARPQTMTPRRFTFQLVEQARRVKRRIVLPEGTEPRILRAADILRRRDVVELVLLGDPAKVEGRAATEGIDLDGIEIIDPKTSPLREQFAQQYAQLRAHKGVTVEDARETMLDVSYFGTMMVQNGIVDGMVSGATHTTAHTIRPSFEIIKTAPGTAIVSSVFLMCLADRVLVYGDCAVNPDPNAEQLADIAVASAATAKRFGVDPKIAMLSYSSGTSGRGESVDKVREATAIVRERHPEIAVDGPIQYDAASNAAIGGSKMPDSSVAGHATVFVFPDLDTGNNTYKAVQQSSGALAVGPILQGLKKPVNDLSRGCTVDDIVTTVAITAIQAG